MKSREEAVLKLSELFNPEDDGWASRGVPSKPGPCYHFGLWELRQLFDYIYEGEPTCDEQMIPKPEDIFK